MVESRPLTGVIRWVCRELYFLPYVGAGVGLESQGWPWGWAVAAGFVAIGTLMHHVAFEDRR